MTALVDMTQAEYDEYIDHCFARYVKRGCEATGMSVADGTAKARAQFARLLPNGRTTPDQHFQIVRTGAGENVGTVWWALQDGGARFFIYDIIIDPDRRGEGHGRGALRSLEAEARRIGAAEIALHVFTTNEGAIRLYKRLGYHVTGSGPGGMSMSKALGGAQ